MPGPTHRSALAAAAVFPPPSSAPVRCPCHHPSRVNPACARFQQARAVATRAQIVRGAAEVFDKSGFEGASLGEITEAAGTTKGAVYFHFRSKEELARQRRRRRRSSRS